MNKSIQHPLSNTIRLLVMAILVVGLTLGTGQIAQAAASPAPVNLGAAAPFAILSKTGITTTGTTAIVGNLGVSPIGSTAITGFGLTADSTNTFSTSSLVTGKVYAADYADPTPANLTTAVSNMEAAYTDAAGRSLPDFTELYSGDLSGQTLAPGLYKWGTGVLITTDVTLSGPADGIWIFQIAGDLTMGSGAQVLLIGGAKSRNIFWQVGGGTGVEIGTTAHVEGTILAAKAIHLRTGATLNGRALAQTAVTLDQVAIVSPVASLLTTFTDFDGDGKTDVAKFVSSTGSLWYVNSSTGAWEGKYLGTDGTYVRGSDFDGDGKTDPAKFVAGTVWYIKSSTGTWDGRYVGTDGDYVSGADFDGDGKTDPAKFVSSPGSVWYLKSGTGTWDGIYIGSDGTFISSW
jgi:hypothetical protein